ncbi:O-succinylbenzoate synthase, partial [Rhodococcus sp. IITR03]
GERTSRREVAPLGGSDASSRSPTNSPGTASRWSSRALSTPRWGSPPVSRRPRPYPTSPYACGLGTGGFFEPTVAPALHMSDGALDVVAVEPEPGRLDALRAEPDRVEWWCERVRRCRTVLAGRGL